MLSVYHYARCWKGTLRCVIPTAHEYRSKMQLANNDARPAVNPRVETFGATQL